MFYYYIIPCTIFLLVSVHVYIQLSLYDTYSVPTGTALSLALAVALSTTFSVALDVALDVALTVALAITIGTAVACTQYTESFVSSDFVIEF